MKTKRETNLFDTKHCFPLVFFMFLGQKLENVSGIQPLATFGNASQLPGAPCCTSTVRCRECLPARQAVLLHLYCEVSGTPPSSPGLYSLSVFKRLAQKHKKKKGKQCFLSKRLVSLLIFMPFQTKAC